MIPSRGRPRPGPSVRSLLLVALLGVLGAVIVRQVAVRSRAQGSLRLLWVAEGSWPYVYAPAVDRDRVYAVLDPGVLAALDAATGQRQRAAGGFVQATLLRAVLDGDDLYLAGGNSGLFAFDRRTLEPRWQSWVYPRDRSVPPPPGPGADPDAREHPLWDLRGPVFDATTLYVGSTEGALYAVARTDGRIRWRAALSRGMAGLPARVGATLYCASRDSLLYAIATANGRERWRFRLGDGLESGGPTVRDSVAYVAGRHGWVGAIELAGPRLRWQRRVPGEHFRLPPHLADGAIVVAGRTGVYALDPADGRERWRFSHPTLACTASGARVYLTDAASELIVLDAHDGHVIARRQLEGLHFFGGPVAAGGRIYVGATRRLYCLVDP